MAGALLKKFGLGPIGNSIAGLVGGGLGGQLLSIVDLGRRHVGGYGCGQLFRPRYVFHTVQRGRWGSRWGRGDGHGGSNQEPNEQILAFLG